MPCLRSWVAACRARRRMGCCRAAVGLRMPLHLDASWVMPPWVAHRRLRFTHAYRLQYAAHRQLRFCNAAPAAGQDRNAASSGYMHRRIAYLIRLQPPHQLRLRAAVGIAMQRTAVGCNSSVACTRRRLCAYAAIGLPVPDGLPPVRFNTAPPAVRLRMRSWDACAPARSGLRAYAHTAVSAYRIPPVRLTHARLHRMGLLHARTGIGYCNTLPPVRLPRTPHRQLSCACRGQVTYARASSGTPHAHTQDGLRMRARTAS
jgi:hypothetical protein